MKKSEQVSDCCLMTNE